MIINEKTKANLPIQDLNNIYVVADFDRTITNGSSKTSWSVLSESTLVPETYVEERQELYRTYRPIEIDETMDPEKRSSLVSEWFRKHIELFVKYKISDELFEKASLDLRVMEFRKGAKEFLKFLYENNIPLIIISAGIGNFIECFLKNNDCYYDNIYISSNKIIFENHVASGVGNNIIHSLNKNEVSLPENIKDKLKNRDNVILLGDQISDLKMVDETKHQRVIKIGFLTKDTMNIKDDYANLFDIVIDNDEDYNDILDILFRKKM